MIIKRQLFIYDGEHFWEYELALEHIERKIGGNHSSYNNRDVRNTPEYLEEVEKIDTHMVDYEVNTDLTDNATRTLNEIEIIISTSKNPKHLEILQKRLDEIISTIK